MIQKLDAANSINLAQNVKFTGPIKEKPMNESKADVAEFSSKEAGAQPPKIGFWRLAFKRLTQEQIDAVNEGGKLPGNAKFFKTSNDGSGRLGGYAVGNNILNINPGTATIPAGYELRKNWLGFTIVVEKDTESIFIRKKAAEAV